MGKTKTTRNRTRDSYGSDAGSATGTYIHHDRSDAVSEISHDSGSVTGRSKYKNKLFGGKKKGDDNASAVSSSSKGSLLNRMGITSNVKTKRSAPVRAPRAPPSPGDSPSVGNRSTGALSKGSQKLVKDSKARYNIGIVYLKTGDYAKAQENLEHSLYCYLTLYGHDHKKYKSEILYAIAGVREKLGDCYLNNAAIADKSIAMDHYEEARRLLRGLDEDNAPEDVVELYERVDEKVKDPAMKKLMKGRKSSAPLPPPPPPSFTPQTRSRGPSSGNRSVDGAPRTRNRGGSSGTRSVGAAAIGAGAGALAVGAAAGKNSSQDSDGGGGSSDYNPLNALKRAKNKVIEGIGDILDDVEDGFRMKLSPEFVQSMRGIIDDDDIDKFEVSIEHLERNNHRSALNHLSALKDSDGMNNRNFCDLMVDYMMRVADSAMKDEKIGVAADAYEEAFALLRQEDEPDVDRRLVEATRGCIKAHKLLAIEEEKDEDWETAIQHRNRVHQLLDMENKVVPTCEQLMKVAWLYDQIGNYTQSEETLAEAKNRLTKGVRSFESIPDKRKEPLIRCCEMRAVALSKLQRWEEAHDHYNEALQLIARDDGLFSRSYNHSLIQKAALLVKLGRYQETVSILDKYMNVASTVNGQTPKDLAASLDGNDHCLALDTSAVAFLKLGNIDRAVFCFEKKLELLRTMPRSDETKAQTLHSLGCLLAYKKNYKDALPMLSKALDTRKFIYEGSNKFIFESTWGVAAASQAMGDSGRAMKEYGKLLDKINKVDDAPVDSVIIHNSAGKLYFEANKFDLALKSFNEAFKRVQASDGKNTPLKINILLSLANVKSARGDFDKAVRDYDQVISTKSIKGSREYFQALYNKSLILLKTGDLEGAGLILDVDLTGKRSKAPDDIKASAYLTLGQHDLSEGRLEDALEDYEKAVELASKEKLDLNPIAIQAKKNIGLAYFEAGDYDTAIDKFQCVLEDLSRPELTGKQVNVLRAEIWSCMSRVFCKKRDTASAKNFAKLGMSYDDRSILQNIQLTHLAFYQHYKLTKQTWVRNTPSLCDRYPTLQLSCWMKQKSSPRRERRKQRQSSMLPSSKWKTLWNHSSALAICGHTGLMLHL
jgi:tetratricopeptide (TPR) repeat protein